MTSKRKITSVELPDGTDAALNAFCRRHNLVKKGVLADMIQFFLNQPDLFKLLLGGVFSPETAKELAPTILERLADYHQNPGDDDGEIIEHPDNPKIVMKKPKSDKTGPKQRLNGKRSHG